MEGLLEVLQNQVPATLKGGYTVAVCVQVRV